MTAPPECVFCRIVAGEVESHVVLEDEVTLAFLDSRPLFPGHTLLVPRAHHETLADLPTALLEPLFASARLLAGAMEDGLDAEGSFVAINNRISQSVPHVHVHVVPRRRRDGLRGFFWPRQGYEDEAQMVDVQRRLRESVERLRSEGPSTGSG